MHLHFRLTNCNIVLSPTRFASAENAHFPISSSSRMSPSMLVLCVSDLALRLFTMRTKPMMKKIKPNTAMRAAITKAVFRLTLNSLWRFFVADSYWILSEDPGDNACPASISAILDVCKPLQTEFAGFSWQIDYRYRFTIVWYSVMHRERKLKCKFYQYHSSMNFTKNKYWVKFI